MSQLTIPRRELSQISTDIVMLIPSGRYAWQPDSETPLTFGWIKDYTSGKRSGQRRIRTQHGPWYQEALTIYPNGNLRLDDDEIEDFLMGVFCDKFGCAQRYGQELNRCARCNLELTDERSRWYGIGPDCEKIWTWFVEEIDNRNEGSFEELQHAS